MHPPTSYLLPLLPWSHSLSATNLCQHCTPSTHPVPLFILLISWNDIWGPLWAWQIWKKQNKTNQSKKRKKKNKKMVGEWSCSAVPQMKSLIGHLPCVLVLNEAHSIWRSSFQCTLVHITWNTMKTLNVFCELSWPQVLGIITWI